MAEPVSTWPVGKRPLNSVHLEPCDGCDHSWPEDKLHRVEIGDKKQKLCDVCCPNCFGGEGNGPAT